jgi:hypothetical protein
LRPQTLVLFCRNAKHEIGWKTFTIAFYLFVQPLNSNPVKFGKIGIEHHPVLPQNQDPRLDGRS